MSRKLSKAEARAYQRRWKLVNAREVDELLATSIDVKWQQFNTLLRWAHAFGWSDSRAREDAEVRARWIRLRKALRGKKEKA